MSFRLCEYGGVWQQPNVSNCATRKFIDIKNKVICYILYHKLYGTYFVDRGIE